MKKLAEKTVIVDGVEASVSVDKLTKREDGRFYQYYNVDMTVDIEEEKKFTIKQNKLDLVKTVDAYIQKPIDDYNKTNGTLFASVHNCSTYLPVTTYAHREFCQKAVDFNAAVWTKAREIESEILGGIKEMPSKEEFVKLLPKWSV